MSRRLLFIVSEDWYFVSHRLHLAKKAIEAGYQVAVLSKVNAHREVIEGAGVKVIDWPLDRRSHNPLVELKTVWSVVAAIRKFRPDLIHAVAIKPVLYSAMAGYLSRSHSRIFAFGGLGYIFSSPKRSARLLRPLIVSAFRRALKGKNTLLILQNPDDRSVLLSARVVGADRIRIIRGAGVDTRLFALVPETEDPPLVVLPARMLWDKGVAEFVNCARQIKNRGGRARFALVGTPDPHNPESVPLPQLEQWQEEGIVEWWGYQEDMPRIYQRAAIVCLPSYREGLPKSLLEAASCGRPIVTYDVPGCREVVIEASNGFLVPLQDEAAMVEAIDRLLGDAGLRAKMGRAGRDLVVAEFSQEQVAAETMRVWDEVLK